jgi:hypothetical protein
VAQTLATLRGYLNAELAVTDDAEASPFSLALRNRAIAQGYAELWRAGCWKPVQQTIAAVTNQSVFSTTVRRLRVIDLLDSASRVVEHPPGRIEETTTGTFELILRMSLATGSSMRVNGWTAYLSVFAGDSTPDDLDDEYNRIPLLKAKAICYRVVLADFARYGTRQSVPPEMNVTVDQALGIVAAAEREFAAETHDWRNLRDRVMQPKNARQFVT